MHLVCSHQKHLLWWVDHRNNHLRDVFIKPQAPTVGGAVVVGRLCDEVEVRVATRGGFGGMVTKGVWLDGARLLVEWWQLRGRCLPGLKGELHYLLDRVVQAGTAPGPNQQQP
ncbi:hypothetical protein Tco_0732554 [Tanacetum coccineum]